MLKIAQSLCVFILLLSLNSLAAAEAEKISIGVILPFSGDLAAFGEKAKRGIILAQEKHGDGFDIVYQDGRFDTKKALTAYQHISSLTPARVIIGPSGLSQTMAIAPAAERDQIAVLAFSSCSDSYLRFKNVFCIYPSHTNQLQTLTDFFESNVDLKGKKLALFFQEMEGVNIISKYIEDFASRVGMNVIFNGRMPEKDTDFRSQLSKARGADLFIAGGVPEKATLALKQLKELNIEPEWRWMFSEFDDVFLRENKAILEEVFIPGWFDKINPDFAKAYRKRWKSEPDLYGALVYDAALSIFKALSGQVEDNDKLISRLTEVDLGDEAASESFKFDKNRQVDLELESRLIRNGKLVKLTGES